MVWGGGGPCCLHGCLGVKEVNDARGGGGLELGVCHGGVPRRVDVCVYQRGGLTCVVVALLETLRVHVWRRHLSRRGVRYRGWW